MSAVLSENCNRVSHCLTDVLSLSLAPTIVIDDNRQIAHATPLSMGDYMTQYARLFDHPGVSEGWKKDGHFHFMGPNRDCLTFFDKREMVMTAFQSSREMKALLVTSICPNLYSAIIRLVRIPIFGSRFSLAYLESAHKPGASIVSALRICT